MNIGVIAKNEVTWCNLPVSSFLLSLCYSPSGQAFTTCTQVIQIKKFSDEGANRGGASSDLHC